MLGKHKMTDISQTESRFILQGVKQRQERSYLIATTVNRYITKTKD